MTVTVTHDGLVGSPFYMVNAAQEEYNGVYTMGANTVNGTIANVVFPGSTTSPATGTPVIYMPHKSTSADFLAYCVGLAGGALTRGLPLGWPGKVSSFIRNKMSLIYQDSPDICLIVAGVNDVATYVTGPTLITSTVNTAYANIIAMADDLIVKGVLPVICTITPIDNTRPGWNVSQQHAILKLNKLLREYCAGKRSVLLCDVYAVLVDPTSTTGNTKLNHTSDGLHWSGLGAWAVATELYNVLNARGLVSARPKILPMSTAESYGINSACLQINDNPLGTAQVGVVTAPATGTAWTGWTLSVLGTAAVAGSSPARADGFGTDQSIAITSQADNDGALFTGTNIAGRLVAGQKIFGVMEVSTAAVTALKELRFRLSIVAGGVPANCEAGYPSASIFMVGDKTYLLVTPVMYIPATANVQPIFSAKFNGSGGATIKVGRVGIYILG
jgi:lysophospholipase L1-like esterase